MPTNFLLDKNSSVVVKLIVLLLVLALTPLQADEIWNELRQGGKVILMRHLPVDKHPDPLVRDPHCEKEQRLSADGVEFGHWLAEQFERFQIPIGDVYTSPYCRTAETGKLVFGKYQPKSVLQLKFSLDEASFEKNREKLNGLIGSYQGEKNLVLITHRPNIDSMVFAVIPRGGFVVLAPMGGEDFDEIGVFSGHPE